MTSLPRETLEKLADLRALGSDLNRGCMVPNLAEQIWDACDAIHKSITNSSSLDDVVPCSICRAPCLFETSVPSALWNEVIRHGGPETGNEYLCASCIIQAFAAAGVSFTAELSGGGVSGVKLHVVVNGRRAQSAARLVEENNDLRCRLRAAEEACMKLRQRAEEGAPR